MLHSEILLSKSKWKKAGLLLRERWQFLIHPLRRLVSSSGAQIQLSGAQDFELKTCASFTRDSVIAIPAELYHLCRRYEQDYYNETTQSVETRFNYKVVSVPDGSFYSNGCTHVSVFDGHDGFLEDLSYQKYHHENKRPNLRMPVDRYIPGNTVSLYGNVENTAGNYGHWLIDGISRLFLVLEAFSIDEIDHFLVPKMKYDFQMESLVKLGIDPKKIIEIEPLECLRFEHLICTTAPRGSSSTVCPEWMVQGFRQKYLNDTSARNPSRKLYISRRDAGSRKFSNENAISKLMESYGFEVIELSKHNFEKKVDLFNDAECVVGLTGAGMSNFMFCSPSAKIVELIPSSYVNYLYTSMCVWLNLDYHYVLFDNDSSLSRANPYYGSLKIDIGKLESKLVTMGYHRINDANYGATKLIDDTAKLLEKKV